MNKKTLKIGQEGEVKVIKRLLKEGIEVKDYTDYETFKAVQQKGYDIEVLNKETEEWDRVDIKTNLKGNTILLEDTNYDHLGWFWTSSADSIYHYNLKDDELYCYELKKMRNYVFKYSLEPTLGRSKNLIGIKIEDTPLIKKL